MLIINEENATEYGCSVVEGKVVVPKQPIDETTTIEVCKGTKEGLLLKGSFDRINSSAEVGRYRALGTVDKVIPYEIVADLLLRKIMYDVNPDDVFENDKVPDDFRTFVKTERTGGGGAKPLKGDALTEAQQIAERLGLVLPEKCTRARLQNLIGKAIAANPALLAAVGK